MVRDSIHGSRNSRPARKATRRGIVQTALSCIEVAICTRLITMPAMKPIASKGAHSQNVVIRVWRMI